MKINKLKPNKTNPRVIKSPKFKKLVQSIKEFPEMLDLRPIVVDENMTILGGNMRYKACLEAGIKDVPVKIAEGLSEEQKQEFIIKDNVGFGEWDWDVLANEWDVKSLSDWGLDIPKWEDTSFDSIMEDTGEYNFPDDNVDPSHVKMVQLFMNTTTEPQFKDWELKLRDQFGTDNLTDTVFEVVKKAYTDLYGS